MPRRHGKGRPDVFSQARDIAVVPLSDDTLRDAFSLVCRIFPHRSDQKIARHSLTESVTRSTKGTRYWVALNGEGKATGITGLYGDRHDKRTTWLGWYGVGPEDRGRGIGSALLRFAIDEARRRGFSALKLYTSSDENERDAHRLYRKFGFTVFCVDRRSDRIYFRKAL